MNSSTRRQFLRFGGAVAVGSGALRGANEYDVLIKGGHVIDPASKLSRKGDVAIRGQRIAKIADAISGTAAHVMNAEGCYVTPGLVDLHVHVYDAVAPIGIPPDPNCIARGVTTVLDGGSAGAHTFPGFRKYVINTSETRIYALLNIGVAGQVTYSPENPHGELLDLRFVNPQMTASCIDQNRDRVLGVKVRLTENIAGDQDREVLKRAVVAARAARVPVMAHIGGSKSPLKELLPMLTGGDVITHAFREGDGGILDPNGRVLPEVRDAIARGIRLDIGHGANGFSFETATRALEQGVIPHAISSDLHSYNVRGPVHDLLTTLSKFLLLGLSAEKVFECATINPARTFAFAEHCGVLREGSIADISVLRLVQQPVTFTDSHERKRTGNGKLEPVGTFTAGRLYGTSTI